MRTAANHLSSPHPSSAFLSRIPVSVWVVAVLAALVHIAPYWRTQSQTPPGWSFTGNLLNSPDVMQYRVWMRRSQQTGVLVDNRFTTTPNRPHLPVVFYYLLGKVSHWTDLQPEFVYAYAGCVIAFGLTILLFVTVRHFAASAYQTWWIFLAILIGGGLGAHLKILTRFDAVRNNFILKRTIVDSLWNTPVFENFRFHYVVVSLSDTHFLIIWLMTLASVVLLYFALQKFTPGRLILTAFLWAATTIVHVYEGFTLMMIGAGVTLLCWRKGLLSRNMLVTLAACAATAGACLVGLLSLYRSSGLPVPETRELNVLFSVFLIAYPLAWVLIAWGITGYWSKAGLKECFLLGWALGCTVLTLSGPFYPYPTRGTITLQIALYVIAGSIYFSRHARVRWGPALVAVFLLGVTPTWLLGKRWKYTGFNPQLPIIFLSTEHREIVHLLRQRATEDDVLLVDKSGEDWTTDDLWLFPYSAGRLYCGHPFLTDDYNGKRAKVIRFFDSQDPVEQAAFLRRERIRFLYVRAAQEPARFERVPGLVLSRAASIGSLFEYLPGASNATQ